MSKESESPVGVVVFSVIVWRQCGPRRRRRTRRTRRGGRLHAVTTQKPPRRSRSIRRGRHFGLIFGMCANYVFSFQACGYLYSSIHDGTFLFGICSPFGGSTISHVRSLVLTTGRTARGTQTSASGRGSSAATHHPSYRTVGHGPAVTTLHHSARGLDCVVVFWTSHGVGLAPKVILRGVVLR